MGAGGHDVGRGWEKGWQEVVKSAGRQEDRGRLGEGEGKVGRKLVK